jgi:cyclopropane fatty-acyl-phospholipid synthase-like methyltransferase
VVWFTRRLRRLQISTNFATPPGPQDGLSVAALTPFDQYHYDGTEAVDLALSRLDLPAYARILDIGAGIGGPARYIADTTGAHVTALELQPDLDDVARDLTRRCGLAARVTHECGDILDGHPRGPFDAIISLLCMLHIPEKHRLFAACRAALRPGQAMYIEDFAHSRPLTEAEAESLAVKVQCTQLPTPDEYRAHLAAAGFSDISITDVTQDWRRVSASRVKAAKAAHDANVALHGAATVAGLEDFYAAVDALWQGGALTGLRILAR